MITKPNGVKTESPVARPFHTITSKPIDYKLRNKHIVPWAPDYNDTRPLEEKIKSSIDSIQKLLDDYRSFK